MTSDKQRTPHYMRRHVESGKEESVLDLNALVDEIEGPFLVEEVNSSIVILHKFSMQCSGLYFAVYQAVESPDDIQQTSAP